MKLSDKQWIFLQDVAKLIIYAEQIGIKLTAGEIYRTMYQQRKYIIDGKSKTLKSKHLSRLAIDLNFFVNGKITYDMKDIEVLGWYWESLRPTNKAGMFWKWRDKPHFQG